MSKRPKTAGSFMSRLRRPGGRLRDMPIWSKLGLIMIVPTIATVVVGTTGLIDHLQTLDNANNARTLAGLTQVSGELVHNLQDERVAAVRLLGARDEKAREAYRQNYDRLHAVVDDSSGEYSRQRAALDDLPTNFSALLARIDQSLADLPATRSQVANGSLKLTEAKQTYELLTNDLLDIRDSASQLASDTSLSERMRAAAAVARAKEFLAGRRIVVHQALIVNSFPPALRFEYIATETGQEQAIQNFKAVATRAEAELYDQRVSGPDQREAENKSGWIRGLSSDSLKDVPFTADRWDAAMVGNAQLIREVETKLDADVVNLATDLRDDVQRQVFLETGLLLGMLLLAILFAWLVARSMARSLRDLRHGALSIAQYGLPQAVSRLRDPQLTAQRSPVQVANEIAEPLPVRSKDEFGQVTEAFNAVHLEAVRTAAEQAALRASVATMFVNLARRSQILVDRLIGHLDRLERGEEDPDRLAELFQLDHLATRMRRNDENLLVLAGADSTRVQREPAALIDVLRAAQSEVEHYTRIEFGVIDRDIEVAAHAVNDMVHLVAELFDNATAFSPPDSQVMVEARRVGDQASLYVEDRGIGITAEQMHELNERLATPPAVDVTVSRMMGLVVVARLASRHGVKVELRSGTDRGTVADVTLPTDVLVPRALAGRGLPGQPAGVDQGSIAGNGPAGAGQTRAPFGAQLALEGAMAAGNRRPADRGAPGPRPFESTGAGPSQPPAPQPGPAPAMPAWSDLTGARSSLNGAETFVPRTPRGAGSAPLPQRRATEPSDGDDPVSAAPAAPRQYPAGPQDWPDTRGRPAATPVSGVPGAPTGMPPVSAPPMPGRPVSGAPVPGHLDPAPSVSGPPAHSGPPAMPPPRMTPPPAWPPVGGTEREPRAAPPVPERLAAALDMTTELPRVPASSAEVPTGVGPLADTRTRYADETMELPIFRELESAWFRTRSSAVDGAGLDASSDRTAGGPVPAQAMRGVDGNLSTGTTGNAAMVDTAISAQAAQEPGGNLGDQPTVPVGFGNGSGRPGELTGNGWRTAADDGWRAASAAAETPVVQTTQTGLPKRVPMAQLVPGGVDKPSTSVQRRTPEGVRGLLSAYHRGVQRGRGGTAGDSPGGPDAAMFGQQSSQAGVGPRVRNGQKEHEA